MSADRIVLDTRRLTVDRQLQNVGGRLELVSTKNDKPRTIVVPGVVAVEIRRHLRDHRDDGLLFRDSHGAALRGNRFYEQAWTPSLVGSGLPEGRYKFHSLRHFCASSLLAEGRRSPRWPAILGTRWRPSAPPTRTGCATTSTFPPTSSTGCLLHGLRTQ